ncbi:suppressor of temperature sensitive growth [Nucleospora cyclopteri]
MSERQISNFEKDLEFVQLICNPEYLKWLYKNNYFSDSIFMKYLNRLLYFDSQRFKKFLHYPQCVDILKMLLKEETLKNLANDEFYENLEKQQVYIWRNKNK